MIALLKSRLALWGAGAVLVAVLGMWATVAWKNRTIDGLEAQNIALTLRLDAAVDANKSNLEVTRELEKELAKLVDQRRLDQLAAARAAGEATQRLEELRRERDAARRRLEADLRSSPACDALADLDVAAACPALGDRLRDLAQRNRQD